MFKYPGECDLPAIDHIVHFCFPYGILTTTMVPKQAMSIAEELEYLSQPHSSYAFRINTEQGFLFGVCVKRTEYLEVNSPNKQEAPFLLLT